jgi:putative endonuclease
MFSLNGLKNFKKRNYCMKRYFVYILASQRNGTLYVGSTSSLIQRIWQHKNNAFVGFTSKYQVHQLVYYEEHQNIVEASRRGTSALGLN